MKQLLLLLVSLLHMMEHKSIFIYIPLFIQNVEIKDNKKMFFVINENSSMDSFNWTPKMIFNWVMDHESVFSFLHNLLNEFLKSL